MARTRYIKPDFFLDDALAALSPHARLLFAGLWTIADREGRLEDAPKKIKAQILPYDEVDVHGLLLELAIKFITRYRADNKNYIQINNFLKHQMPHYKEAKSVIPAASGQDQPNVDPTLGQSKRPMTPLNGQWAMGNGERTKDVVSNGFAEFWAKWPKKEGEKEASLVWESIAPAMDLRATISKAVDAQAKAKDWANIDPKYIPGAAKWLKGEQWKNEVKAEPIGEGERFLASCCKKCGIQHSSWSKECPTKFRVGQRG